MERAVRIPKVQFVSKPIVSPFRDGSKCLVRDLCLHLEGVEAHVMGTRDAAPELGNRVVSHAVYGGSGGFSPALRQNLQAALFLLATRRADLWHFVFAPNPLSSRVGGALRKMRGVPTVQTIASPPRSFESPEKLIFGDVAVAQSEWTKQQLVSAFVSENKQPPRIEVIYPPAPEVVTPSEEEMNEVRSAFGCHGAQPLFVYPGDLEVSRGARTVVELSRRIREHVPFARVVIAYRDKTSHAGLRAEELADQCNLEVVRFGCNVKNIHALVAAATAIVFPVDDLYGKVDLPIVLLEAFRLGTPVLALDEGPLKSLEGALRLPNDQDRWLAEMSRLALDGRAYELQREMGYRAIEHHYAPTLVAQRYQRIYRDLLD